MLYKWQGAKTPFLIHLSLPSRTGQEPKVGLPKKWSAQETLWSGAFWQTVSTYCKVMCSICFLLLRPFFQKLVCRVFHSSTRCASRSALCESPVCLSPRWAFGPNHLQVQHASAHFDCLEPWNRICPKNAFSIFLHHLYMDLYIMLSNYLFCKLLVFIQFVNSISARSRSRSRCTCFSQC